MEMKYVAKKPEHPIRAKKAFGVPKFIDPEKDLCLHLGFHSDSNFVVTNMKGDDGREFNFLIHQMVVNPAKDPKSYPLMLSIISMTDKTNRSYIQKETVYEAGQFNISTERMDISCATSGIKGTLDNMDLWGELPDGKGKVEVKITRHGPVLYNCATGLFPFLSNEVDVWQFSSPHLKAVGILTMDGKKSKISGDAWFDRQWDDLSPDFFNKLTKWKWMNLNLDNGYKISIWDMTVHNKNENAWATVLAPDGTHTVADIVPLSEGESEFWTSPVTGQTYATNYVVKIPGLDAEFVVKAYDGLPGQEVVSPSGDDKYEAACTFTGKFMGKPVSGFNYVELVGNFLQK
jgi:predicted secreted hydrolase